MPLNLINEVIHFNVIDMYPDFLYPVFKLYGPVVIPDFIAKLAALLKHLLVIKDLDLPVKADEISDCWCRILAGVYNMVHGIRKPLVTEIVVDYP